MLCNWPFNPLEHIMKDANIAQLLEPVPQLQIPNNLPPEIMRKVMQNILNAPSIINIPPVDYKLFIAALESTRCKSYYYSIGKINATRLPNLTIQTFNMAISKGWEFQKNEDRVGE